MLRKTLVTIDKVAGRLRCFVGVPGPEVSEERVAMRVSDSGVGGGHDVPTEKLVSRYPRTMENLRKAMRELLHVWVFDNDDLRRPFRLAAVCEAGPVTRLEKPVPGWLRRVLPS